MKKKIMRVTAIFIIIVLGISACGKKESQEEDYRTEQQEQSDKSGTAKNEEVDNQENYDNSTEGLEDASEEKISDDVTTVPKAFARIYSMNDDATGFNTKEVEIETLSPENVLGAMIDNGVLAANVKIISFKESEKEEKRVLDIDFSKEFTAYMNNMGTSGEYLVMGCVCNTFLEAYGCEKIHITVDGRTLTTGHAEYPGYLTFFK